MASSSEKDEIEAFTSRIENLINEKFREFRLTQARLLRESAELTEGDRKILYLRMASEWEKAAETNS